MPPLTKLKQTIIVWSSFSCIYSACSHRACLDHGGHPKIPHSSRKGSECLCQHWNSLDSSQQWQLGSRFLKENPEKVPEERPFLEKYSAETRKPNLILQKEPVLSFLTTSVGNKSPMECDQKHQDKARKGAIDGTRLFIRERLEPVPQSLLHPHNSLLVTWGQWCQTGV